uniref:Uncharacterized protein n=1 Tax=Heterorhabditis bacteriophora TaxID=37862 RepID=A0A1I7WHI6_HETBA
MTKLSTKNDFFPFVFNHVHSCYFRGIGSGLCGESANPNSQLHDIDWSREMLKPIQRRCYPIHTLLLAKEISTLYRKKHFYSSCYLASSIRKRSGAMLAIVVHLSLCF